MSRSPEAPARPAYYAREIDLEQQCIRDGEKIGFIVHRNSQRRFQGQEGYTGETPGLPDTTARQVGMPAGVTANVELKRNPKAVVRRFQVKRLEEGFSVVAYTPEAFCRYLLAVRRLWQSVPREDLERFDREIRAIEDLRVRE